ncbi:MAG: hypothetical protein Kow0074_12740 [Candidatus Zixiibacteriota bacterium]
MRGPSLEKLLKLVRGDAIDRITMVDLENPEYSRDIKRYLSGAIDGVSRIRAARLVEWLTLGAGVPGCMHGGGSPDGDKLVVRSRSNWNHSAETARKLAGIEKPIEAPGK